jgi:ribosome-associated protein
MTDHIYRNLKIRGVKGIAIEGMPQCDWVLVDVGDVIVHLFRPEVRDFYNLEKIWLAPEFTDDEMVTEEVPA